MTHDHQPDELLDRTLAALRDAAPPEGMTARILQSLDAQRLAAHKHSASSRLGGLVPESAWLRGAAAGAAAASLAFGALLFALHPAHPRPPQQTATAAPSTTPHSVEAARVSMTANSASAGCPASRRDGEWDRRGESHPGSAWIGSAAANARSPRLIPASFAPSKPAPPAPLTAQERALVQFAQLARSATPAELAALGRAPAAANESEAEREAAFRKFFAPSPEVLAIDKAQGVNVDSNQTTAPQAPAVQPENPATRPQPSVEN